MANQIDIVVAPFTINTATLLPLKLASKTKPSLPLSLKQLLLTALFANQSRSCAMSLKDKLSHLTKGSKLVADYLHEIQTVADELALIGHPLDDLDLVVHALNGLGSDYKEITVALKFRDIPVSFEDLFEKLTDYECYLKCDELIPVVIPIATANVIKHFHPKHNSNNKHHGSSNQSTFFGPRKNPSVICQYCECPGHNAKTCYQIFGRPPRKNPIANHVHN
ncbi:hypothetical protein L6164_021014 [Bauhinia variegata]|uniref:Uncharacterized protein n=1 Tax=Bauhinia variegata TaxID=167791 RepID=A0ACB9MX82_BAUVA|nr:hypothetical protein L6164_021014 [Bauhinia variegata]